jgi:hypothetical protein
LIVRPGGLVVVRGGRQDEVLSLIEELDLEASIVDSLVVGRRPAESEWFAPAEPILPPLEVDRLDLRRAGPRRLRLLALGVTGSLVGAGVGLALPLGGSLVSPDHASVDKSGSAAPTSTVSPSGPKGPVVAAQRSGAGSRTAASSTSRPSHGGGRGGSRNGITAYSGTGRRKLGTIRVNEPLFLRWDADNGSFRIVSEAWGFKPRTRKGRLLLSPGAYRRFEVRGTGRWRLELTKP